MNINYSPKAKAFDFEAVHVDFDVAKQRAIRLASHGGQDLLSNPGSNVWELVDQMHRVAEGTRR